MASRIDLLDLCRRRPLRQYRWSSRRPLLVQSTALIRNSDPSCPGGPFLPGGSGRPFRQTKPRAIITSEASTA